ncbi:MAG: hypothetical protein P8M53_04990 [Pirellulales bacterium]|nr:hypothetical protein [Pirellulales bacterium]
MMLRNAFNHWNSFLLFVFSGSIILLATGTVAVAQEDEILDRLYGNGVHAYKRGDYVQAHRWLTEAIDTGNRDPRTRYFRGLAYLKLGRPEQADKDFATAANREVGDGNLARLVDQSLFTIQGPDRYRLESARTNAQRERHLRNKGMIQERNAKPEQIRPGTPRNAEPAEGTMKDLPVSDDALLDTDQESGDNQQKPDAPGAEDELFSTDEEPAKSDPPAENETADPFDDLFDEEPAKKPADNEESDDDIFGQ